MTRRKLNRHLGRITLIFVFVLVISLMCKFSGDPFYTEIHNFIKDMSLLLVTLVAVYLASIFQRRMTFLQSLREEWREIVDTKTRVILYLVLEDCDKNNYSKTYHQISSTIDYMRIVYRNVGENSKLIGYYPYEPLHDMRRAFRTVAPENQPTAAEKQKVKKEIIASFLALRERFLDEFDLEEPTRPILAPNSRRVKQKGASRWHRKRK